MDKPKRRLTFDNATGFISAFTKLQKIESFSHVCIEIFLKGWEILQFCLRVRDCFFTVYKRFNRFQHPQNIFLFGTRLKSFDRFSFQFQVLQCLFQYTTGCFNSCEVRFFQTLLLLSFCSQCTETKIVGVSSIPICILSTLIIFLFFRRTKVCQW